MSDTDRDETRNGAPEAGPGETVDGNGVADPVAVPSDTPDRGLDAQADEGADTEPEDRVTELRGELDALNDRHLRLAAEFDNYRKRNQRERQALASRLQADLIRSVLEVLDDLHRVSEGSADDLKAEAVLEGVRLVEKKFMTVLEGVGVTAVEVEDVPFDPEVMEALGTVATDEPEKDGRVADVFQRGYRLGDVLIRPARVRVYQEEGAD